MAEVYRATRILLQPAVNVEAFGRTVAEAAAFGVPSVVSRQGGLPEALGPGGVAVEDFQNADAWVEAVERVERSYADYSRRALAHSRKFRNAPGAVLRRLSASGVRGSYESTRRRPSPAAVTLMTAGFPGVRGAFQHLAAVVPFARARRFDFRRRPPPGLCVLGGWHRRYEEYIRRHRRGGTAFAVSWHSSWSQIEQSGEWAYLEEVLALLRAGLIRRLFVSCRETAALLRGRPGVEWLPDAVDCSLAAPAPQAAVSARKGVDLFCSAAPRKNLFAQAAALVGLDAVLHVNAMNADAVQPVAATLGVRTVRHDLPDASDYRRVLGGMTAGLQATLAESFNYVAAEHMLLGVPVVVSRHVPCRPPDDRLVVADEHSPAAIRATLRPVVEDAALRSDLAESCRRHILALGETHNRRAADVLRRAAA
jgi:hypothetical protein